MPAAELTVTSETRSGVAIIRVAGPVDHVQYFKLEECIQTQLDRKRLRLVIDLTELTYICSAGINTLGHATAQYEKIRGSCCLVRPGNVAQWQFFTTIGVDRIFLWAATLDEAIRKVTGTQGDGAAPAPSPGR